MDTECKMRNRLLCRVVLVPSFRQQISEIVVMDFKSSILKQCSMGHLRDTE